ncbi:MAG: hypothetical protein P8M30_07145 [Planctomycetaceae bacterium]|jgi:hypothetical protein|nr:hypothetical protein [Planctomycetaceae bacterium]
MSIDRDQMLMGYAIAMVCLVGLVYSRWFLNSTKKGRWLLIKLGPANGLWVLRTVFLAGVAVGICLALDVIQPL